MAEARTEVDVRSLTRAGSTRSQGVVWLALLVALSPVLTDLGSHWLAQPWARYSIVFVPLAAWVALQDPIAGRHGAADLAASERGEGSLDGVMWIGLGVALALVSSGGGMARYGRVGLWIALFGMARWTGRPAMGVVALAAFAIPLPDVFVRQASPGLEVALLELARLPLAAFSGPLEIVRPDHGVVSVLAGTARLEIGPAQGGLPVALGLAGLGYASGLLAGGGAGRAARRGLATSALLALPLQVSLLALALVLLAAGRADWGAATLRHGALALMSVGALAVAAVSATGRSQAAP